MVEARDDLALLARDGRHFREEIVPLLGVRQAYGGRGGGRRQLDIVLEVDVLSGAEEPDLVLLCLAP